MLTEVADGCWQTLVQTLAIREDYEKVLKPSGFCFGRGPTRKRLSNLIFVGKNGWRRKGGEGRVRNGFKKKDTTKRARSLVLAAKYEVSSPRGVGVK